MTREQYFELKDLLKKLAVQIKETKGKKKDSQRLYQSFKKDNPNYLTWSSKQLIAFKPVSENMHQLSADVTTLKQEYRYQHIVYSIARGRTYKEIEPKVDKINQIDFNAIKRYFDVWAVEMPVSIKTDLICAA